jgi:hypothetical protein
VLRAVVLVLVLAQPLVLVGLLDLLVPQVLLALVCRPQVLAPLVEVL